MPIKNVGLHGSDPLTLGLHLHKVKSTYHYGCSCHIQMSLSHSFIFWERYPCNSHFKCERICAYKLIDEIFWVKKGNSSCDNKQPCQVCQNYHLKCRRSYAHILLWQIDGEDKDIMTPLAGRRQIPQWYWTINILEKDIFKDLPYFS